MALRRVELVGLPGYLLPDLGHAVGLVPVQREPSGERLGGMGVSIGARQGTRANREKERTPCEGPTQMWVQRVHLGMARKNVAFKIRLSEDLRQAFADACRREHRPAAQVVRELMRGYISGVRTNSDRPLTRGDGRGETTGNGDGR